MLEDGAGEVKVCSKCAEVKGLEGFPSDRRNKDGAAGDCKDCRKKHKRAWVEANRERIRAYARTEQVLAKNRAWKAARRDQMSIYRRSWYEKNREHCITYASMYLETHPERSEVVAKKRQTESAELADAYVRRVLSNTGIPAGDAPDWLIALKREQLAIRRMARELKQASKGEPK
ncbi:hypothetical protein [Paracidovorax wautersii]|uniref:Bacteriophage Lambda NinG protein n=1 Tax=Paracidovorax wautersii TaxID=1177982 RepID=A0ABU1IG90_9BURK|nr:hypothetical protein [Paracidovorax wautersii]MDR6216235.1 hypothetical protein [Paracidovorax wautersii]